MNNLDQQNNLDQKIPTILHYTADGIPHFKLPKGRAVTMTLQLLREQKGEHSLNHFEEMKLATVFENIVTDRNGRQHSVIFTGKPRPRSSEDSLMILLPSKETTNTEHFVTDLRDLPEEEAKKIIRLQLWIMKNMQNNSDRNISIDCVQHFTSKKIFDFFIKHNIPTTSLVAYHTHFGASVKDVDTTKEYQEVAPTQKKLFDVTPRLYYDYLLENNENIPNLNVSKSAVSVSQVKAKDIHTTIAMLKFQYEEFINNIHLHLNENIPVDHLNITKKTKRYLDKFTKQLKIEKENASPDTSNQKMKRSTFMKNPNNIRHIKGGIRIQKHSKQQDAKDNLEETYTIYISPLTVTVPKRFDDHFSITADESNTQLEHCGSKQRTTESPYARNIRKQVTAVTNQKEVG